MFAGKVASLPENWPLYVSLMKLNEDHQQLINSVKVKWEGRHVNGYLKLSDELESGYYLVGIFINPEWSPVTPLDFAVIYIYNPRDDPEEVPATDKTIPEKIRTYPIPPGSGSSEKIKLEYEIKDDPNDHRKIFNGKINLEDQNAPQNQIALLANLSISVVDKKFFDQYQFKRIKDYFQHTISPDLLQMPAEIKDSIRKENNYIHGKLLNLPLWSVM
jgi:hypothetical protein